MRVDPRYDNIVFLGDVTTEISQHGSLVSSLASHIVSRSGKFLIVTTQVHTRSVAASYFNEIVSI